MMKHAESCDFIKLAGVLGIMFLAVLVLVLVFAEDMLVFVLTNTVWAFVVLGIVLGAFMSKSREKK